MWEFSKAQLLDEKSPERRHKTPQTALTQPMTRPTTHPRYEYFSRWCTVVCIWHSPQPSAHSMYTPLRSLTLTMAMPRTQFLCCTFLYPQSVAWFPQALPQTTREVSRLSCYNPLGPPSWLAVVTEKVFYVVCSYRVETVTGLG